MGDNPSMLTACWRLYAHSMYSAYNMTPDRLPESVHTLYAELLDQAVQAEAEIPLGMPLQGSFVSKTIKGRRYWYLQRLEGERKRQHYLGADSESLTKWMREVAERRQET